MDHTNNAERRNDNVDADAISESSEDFPNGADAIGPDLERAQTTGEAYSVFTVSEKRWIVLMVGIASFFSPLSANIYFPALGALSRQLHVSTELINLTITSYMIFQGLAPTFFGEIADMVGRRPVYITCFVVYLGANIGLALQRNYAALLVLRMLQSSGSSAVIALGNGVVADIAHAGERGMYMGLVNLGAMCGPAVGPVIGGVIANELGWWWIFWVLVILAALFLAVILFYFPETGRMIVGNGSIKPHGINTPFVTLLRRAAARKKRHHEHPDDATIASTLSPRRPFRFPNPLACIFLIFHKDMAIVLFCNSIYYTAFYCVTASTPSLFADIYGYNELQIGLCYIPFGVGCALASIMAGKIVDHDYRRTARKIGITPDKRKGDDMDTFPIERSRLHSVFWMAAVYVAVLISYGWVLQQEANLAAPLVLQFLVGIFGTGIFNILSTLIVDLYPLKPSTATACNNFVRCLIGAGGTAVIETMINNMTRGWCFTFIGLVVAVQTPLLLVERKYGMQWRLARNRQEKTMDEKTVGQSTVNTGDIVQEKPPEAAPEKEVGQRQMQAAPAES